MVRQLELYTLLHSEFVVSPKILYYIVNVLAQHDYKIPTSLCSFGCGWWLVLICYERKVLLAVWWLVLIWYERKELLAGKPSEQCYGISRSLINDKIHNMISYFVAIYFYKQNRFYTNVCIKTGNHNKRRTLVARKLGYIWCNRMIHV